MSPLGADAATSLYFFTISTPSWISSSGTNQSGVYVTLQKCKNRDRNVLVFGSVSLKLKVTLGSFFVEVGEAGGEGVKADAEAEAEADADAVDADSSSLIKWIPSW